jgi:ankyrin repeat protein
MRKIEIAGLIVGVLLLAVLMTLEVNGNDLDKALFDAVTKGCQQADGKIYAGCIAEVQDALAKGANVNATQENGSTPLMLASKYGNLQIVQLLIARGANANATDIGGKTALDRAIRFNHTDIINALRLAGAK